MASLGSILVPIDFSVYSLNALTTAVAMSERHGAELHLLHVIDLSTYHLEETNNELSLLSTEEILHAETAKIKELAHNLAKQHSIRCSGGCRVGSIETEIVAEANKTGDDLIVLGTHGTSDSQSLYTGTEAYRVIKTAACPVLTVPDRSEWTTFNRILFPVRPVPGALEKYDFARLLTQQSHAELIVLALYAPDEVISLGQLQDEIAILHKQLAEDGIQSRTLFCPTDLIAETILQKAEELASDLLIITATLDTTLQDFFVGPFSQQIVHNARIPVLSIRPQSTSAGQRIAWHYGSLT
jgi:nucleotide-binding universal stress UspA family protein